jgi:O-antigen/teichoic acid export membrane protein
VFTSAEKMAPYLLAYTLMEAIERLMGKATDVYFSTLVKVGSFQQQVEFHTRTCNRIAMFLMPLLAIGIMAAPMVVKVYGSNYRAAGLGILFAVLVCRVMFRILGQVHYQLFMIQGEIYLATRCYYLALFVQLITIFPLAKFYGTLGIAYSVCISTFVLTLSQNLIFNHRKYMDMKSFLITFGYAAAGFTALVFLEM